jgi:hypothetical protein
MMRVFTSTCLAMVCAAGLAAQSQTADQRKADPARTDEKSVTIVGCLRAGDTPNTFILANVKDESASKAPMMEPNPANPTNPPARPTEPPSNPATPPNPPATQDPSTIGTSGAMKDEVRLIGAPASVDLSKHVGHTVAITGSWAEATKADRPTGTAGAEKSTGPEKKSFNVKSLAHRSESCQ